jgi:hypothetical protein
MRLARHTGFTVLKVQELPSFIVTRRRCGSGQSRASANGPAFRKPLGLLLAGQRPFR